jgi:hypothetical protein
LGRAACVVIELFLQFDLAGLEVDVFKVGGLELLLAKGAIAVGIPPLIDTFLAILGTVS